MSENDFLPKELCSICAERLKDFRNFKELCLGSHRTLMTVIENGTDQELGATTVVISSSDSDSTVSLDLKCYENEIINHQNELLLPENTKKDITKPEIIKCDSTKIEEFDQNFFYCAHCTKRFRRKLLLCKHLNNTHFPENVLKDQESTTNKQKQLKCPYESCSKRFFYKQDILDAHIRSHLSEY